MAKESYCPGKNLIDLVIGIPDFETLDREPDVGKKYAVMLGDETLDEYLERVGIDKYNLKVQDYIKRQNLLSELHKYGKTKKEILEGLRKHVKICQTCSNKYLEYILLSANGLINLKEKFAKKGLFAILKEEDKRFLGLLN